MYIHLWKNSCIFIVLVFKLDRINTLSKLKVFNFIVIWPLTPTTAINTTPYIFKKMLLCIQYQYKLGKKCYFVFSINIS